jgi:hypothetical protein
MWHVLPFADLGSLQAYMIAQTITLAEVASIFQDNNGHYVLVYRRP